jgi:hypothetical protein
MVQSIFHDGSDPLFEETDGQRQGKAFREAARFPVPDIALFALGIDVGRRPSVFGGWWF